ncbi:MAG: GTPase HflX [Clostridia bacterium]|nr:GTPase HflX [Clostridia bacterium]
MRKNEVHGNLEGIRDTLIDRLAALYDVSLDEDLFLPRELAEVLAQFTGAIRREIAVYITRDGEIVDVSVGSDRDVELRDYRLRRNAQRLSCVRCVHTHPNGDPRLSDVDISAMRGFRYDAMVAIGCLDGAPVGVQASFLTGENDGDVLITDIVSYKRIPDAKWLEQIAESDRLVGHSVRAEQEGPEKCVLMGIESEESLRELARLAETAGAQVVASFLQKRDRPDGALLIGRGRAEELSRQIQALEADLCIFDEELTGIQVRNLEDILHVKVVDRTTLILDIFAQRASSSEGKLQVELAQLEYQSTRLIGQGLVLSRLGGGIGTRGPGESKLEMNRRRIRERMTELRRRLAEVERQRDSRRKNRERNEIPVVALVGYTNAGKSTLLNAMTGSSVYVHDQLFATLDSVSRRVDEGDAPPFLLVDTVGFIRKLPHTLVSAFRATLEEAVRADVLLLVSDGASRDILMQHDTVEQVLQELGATEQPRIEVINKCDLLPEEQMIPFPGAIAVSAKEGTGLDTLIQAIREALGQTRVSLTLAIPYSDYALVNRVRSLGSVREENHTDTGTELTLDMLPRDRDRLISQIGAKYVKTGEA